MSKFIYIIFERDIEKQVGCGGIAYIVSSKNKALSLAKNYKDVITIAPIKKSEKNIKSFLGKDYRIDIEKWEVN